MANAVVLGSPTDPHRSLRRRGPEAPGARSGSEVSKTSRLPWSERDPDWGRDPEGQPGVSDPWLSRRGARNESGGTAWGAGVPTSKSSAGFQKIPLCATAPNVATPRHRSSRSRDAGNVNGGWDAPQSVTQARGTQRSLCPTRLTQIGAVPPNQRHDPKSSRTSNSKDVSNREP